MNNETNSIHFKTLEKMCTIFDCEIGEIKYKIIDNLPENVKHTDYINNIEIKKIVNKINEIDMNNTTFQQAFNILLDIQNKLKNLQ